MLRQPLLVRTGIVVNAGLALALAIAWLDTARRGEFWRADFRIFYTAWSMVLDGDGPRLYDLDLQTEYQRRLVPEGGPDAGLLPFNYPPHAAVPAAVGALLSRSMAFYAWTAIQLVLMAVLLRQLLRLATGWPEEMRVLLVATVVGFPAVFATFQLGQPSLLVLTCLVGLTCALEEDRRLRGAAWLVLATVKPQLAVVPAVALLAGRRWRVLACAGGLFLGWAALATLVLGPSAWLDWLGVIRHSAGRFGDYGIFPERMYNLKGLLAGVLREDHAGTINAASLAALGLVVVVTAAMWRGAWPADVHRFRLRWALCLQLGLLANPHFNPADAVVCVLPAVLFCTSAPRDRWFAAVVALLVVSPLVFLVDCYGVARWPGGVRPFFVVMVVLAAALARAIGRRDELLQRRGDDEIV